jgi:His/Glu/Gln/Arg/opine family amino acid ABC transporter permease subunit
VSEALRQSLDLALFWEYRFVLFGGLLFNAAIFACAAAAALVLGLCAALLRVSLMRPLRWGGTVYVELFRNAPDYVMLVWVHFVLPLLLGLALRTRIEFHPFVSAVVALGLVYSGYFAETFRAGIQAIPKGNIEAGRAVGMSEALILRRITLGYPAGNAAASALYRRRAHLLRCHPRCSDPTALGKRAVASNGPGIGQI